MGGKGTTHSRDGFNGIHLMSLMLCTGKGEWGRGFNSGEKRMGNTDGEGGRKDK